MGALKQLLRDEHDVPLVVRAATALLHAGCSTVVVITGAHHAQVAAAIHTELATDVASGAIVVLENPVWHSGLSSSIRAAVEWALALGGTAKHNYVDALLITTSDMPDVHVQHLQMLISKWRNSGARVASLYEDAGPSVRGVPAVFPRSDGSALLLITGDKGARDLLVATDTLSVPLRSGNLDIDTPADVERWRATHHSHLTRNDQ